MSTRVAVVCEDHTNDQYIVKPILEAALREAGRSNASVHVVTNPQLRGWESVKSEACALLRRYAPISDVVVFAVDLDCDDGRAGAANKPVQLSNRIARCDVGSSKALLVFGQHEVEVWALWGSRADLGTPWASIRDHCDPKEAFFAPLLTALGIKGPGEGRRELVAKSLDRGWRSLVSGCPELGELVDALRQRL